MKIKKMVPHFNEAFLMELDLIVPDRGMPGAISASKLCGAILSGLMIAGGVAIIIVSGGTATPFVSTCAGALISSGITGGQVVFQGDHTA